MLAMRHSFSFYEHKFCFISNILHTTRVTPGSCCRRCFTMFISWYCPLSLRSTYEIAHWRWEMYIFSRFPKRIFNFPMVLILTSSLLCLDLIDERQWDQITFKSFIFKIRHINIHPSVKVADYDSKSKNV